MPPRPFTALAAALIALPGLAAAQQAPLTPTGPEANPGVILIQDSKEEDRAALQSFLPEPMEGWSREIVMEHDGRDVAMLGDGFVVEADYRGPDGTVNLAMLVDAPVIAQMAPMFGNAATMGMLGEVVAINGRDFIATDTREFVGLIDGRIMVSVSGNRINRDSVIAYIEQIDFDGLASFDR